MQLYANGTLVAVVVVVVAIAILACESAAYHIMRYPFKKIPPTVSSPSLSSRFPPPSGEKLFFVSFPVFSRLLHIFRFRFVFVMVDFHFDFTFTENLVPCLDEPGFVKNQSFDTFDFVSKVKVTDLGRFRLAGL
mmetsp:Transcript_880/g.1965  ORF Transcript_880/g.1965 Transcript_880/m.1965 type:complete len:134 (+) Transcript_880:306-707(+)